MSLTKEAKMLSDEEVSRVLELIKNHRYPLRDKVMFLLSFKAGLRAIEISKVCWSMVTNASGHIAKEICITNEVAKGKKGGRRIDLHKDLQLALIDLYNDSPPLHLDNYIIKSGHGARLMPCSISHWFRIVYKTLGLDGCSSHSGRRTFATKLFREIPRHGGTPKDIQYLMGHASITTTMKYVVPNEQAQSRAIQLI